MKLYRTLMADAEQPQADTKRIPHPVVVLAICSSIDLTHKNPDIKRIALRNLLLTYLLIRI
jgi:hypothetical protein